MSPAERGTPGAGGPDAAGQPQVGQGRSVEAVLPCDPDTAYDLLSDVVATARLSDELVGLRWDERADPGRVSVGERFTSSNSLMGMSWSSTSTVTCAQPGRRFAFAVNGPETPPPPGRSTCDPSPRKTRPAAT